MGVYPQLDPLVEDKELGQVADRDSQIAAGSPAVVGTLLAAVGSRAVVGTLLAAVGSSAEVGTLLAAVGSWAAVGTLLAAVEAVDSP